MESSFFEYRDNTGVERDSDTEIINDSTEESFVLTTKTPLKKNQTVIPESEESVDYDDSDAAEEEVAKVQPSKPVLRKSILESVVYSSDDGTSELGSRRQSQNMSYTNVEPSSSDEEEVSPELIPKRRPPVRSNKSLNSTNDSPVVRRVKKRMMLLDSDTDNSIIIEKNNSNKMKCLKDTPLKIDSGKDGKVNDSEESDVSLASEESGTESDGEQTGDEDETDDGPDEDQMAMSRATRMSIIGIIPKQNESDESDFIESDDSAKQSIGGSTESLTDLPAVDLTYRSPAKMAPEHTPFTDLPAVDLTYMSPAKLAPEHTPLTDLPAIDLTYMSPAKMTPDRTQAAVHKPIKPLKTPEKPAEQDKDDSVLTCSPFSSPLHNITNNDFAKPASPVVAQMTPKLNSLKDKVMSKLMAEDAANKENEDDDVTVIDSAPDVITLSSDDEELSPPAVNIKKSPKSPKPKDAAKRKDNTIRQYLPPPSYPNQVVYVPKHVRDNELNTLNGLQADLQNVRTLLENMDVTTLPDGGSRLIMRLTDLEEKVRKQGDRVGNMVVEPSQPTAGDIARDGLDPAPSWDTLQQASHAVQPRMFGKQAMSTHLAERNLILERLRDLHESLASRPPEDRHATAPVALRSELLPHQRHALAWLRWRETQRPPGGVLADDMGLGKTITMISLIASDKENHDDGDDSDDDDDDKPRGRLVKGGTLVVCPASLMAQWEAEVTKHCLPHRISCCLHHGAARATQPQRLAHHDMVMTTYNILQRDSEKNGVLMRLRWRRVILDEAHIVRNHKASTSRAVCGLRARRRWALTGTPVHNKDLDLFALLKFLRCTPFDDLLMWKKWIDNKSQGGQERLSTIMRCILLRRTKQQLQDKGQLKGLPSRTAHDKNVTLTKEEMNVYQKVLVFSKTLFAQFLHQRAEKQADGGLMSSGSNAAYHNMHKKMIALQGAKPVKSHEILVLLLRLRQVCCHCGLIAAMLDPEDATDIVEDEGGKDLLAELNKLTLEDARERRKSGEKEKEQEPEEEGTTAAEAIRSVLAPNNPVFQLQRRSSKIQAVMDCLMENVLNTPDEKAVVVSQWTSVLRLVEHELKERRVRSVTLSGAVAVPARAALVAAVNDPRSGVRVMLLSLCAGGVGLNLCGANHLLLLDPHWNPQLEQQAQDRIYRVGQQRPVHVYRFMCVDTVEQSIRKLQDAKLELAASVLTGARPSHASKLSIEDLKLLFNMGPVEG